MTIQQNTNPTIAMINAAMPSPFFGPVGDGVNPEYGCGAGGG